MTFQYKTQAPVPDQTEGKTTSPKVYPPDSISKPSKKVPQIPEHPKLKPPQTLQEKMF